MSRNSGLFWALLQCSLLWGNIFVFTYFQTDDEGNIKKETITVTYTVLTVLGLVGVGAFILLGKPESNQDEGDTRESENVGSFISQSLSIDLINLCWIRVMPLILLLN